MQEMFLRSGKSNIEYNVKLTEEFLGEYVAHIYYGSRNYIDNLI